MTRDQRSERNHSANRGSPKRIAVILEHLPCPFNGRSDTAASSLHAAPPLASPYPGLQQKSGLPDWFPLPVHGKAPSGYAIEA